MPLAIVASIAGIPLNEENDMSTIIEIYTLKTIYNTAILVDPNGGAAKTVRMPVTQGMLIEFAIGATEIDRMPMPALNAMRRNLKPLRTPIELRIGGAK